MVDLSGKSFGGWKVEKFSHKKKTQQYWLCRCSCGRTIKPVRRSELISGKSKSCRKCHLDAVANKRRMEYGEAAFRNLFRKYLKSAKRRGLEFSLTESEFKSLTKGSCYYCGKPPSLEIGLASRTYGCYIYNGIDRLESSIGYVITNCVSCCKTCNFMKKELSLGEFLSAISSVYKYRHLGG